MFAIDYPFLTMSGARAWLEALPVSNTERAAIAHGNAEKLLRLGQGSVGATSVGPKRRLAS